MDIANYKAMANTDAPLPEIYQKAKILLIGCTKIDECKTWADKMLALGSYAKQAGDESLERLAKQIRATAMKRAGELLSEFDGRGRPEKNTTATVGILSQREAAENAGFSERQQLTAVRIANIPDAEFTELIESDNPPGTTELAELGKKTNGVVVIKNENHEASAIQLREVVEDLYYDHIKRKLPAYYSDVMGDEEKERVKVIIPNIIIWLDEFMKL